MKSIIATLVLAAAALVSFSGSAQAHGHNHYGSSYGYNSYYTPSYAPVYRPVYVQPIYPTYNYNHCW